MDIVEGAVVRAKSGRDKGGYYVVVDVLSSNRVYICDGKRRKVERPKLKNIIHLEFTQSIAQEFSTNRQIKTYLKQFYGGQNV